ncbi:MAG: DUF4337 family protein [Planctomycetes bacterium]|nr:DUF4337 family protein [Planctomycetota bacterium]
MNSHELHEAEHSAEHGAADPSMARVSLTTLIIAVLVALASVSGHRAHTEELLAQAKASDQWSFYQAKAIRGHASDMFKDLYSVISATDPKKAAELQEKAKTKAEGYEKDKKEIEEKAHELEKERDTAQHEADRFDLGELLLEVGLVMTSLTLLTKQKKFWLLGGLLAVAGVAVAATGFFVH